ncbi:uncharacterized protein CTHT_0021120 [Thermochaetoides thermophila DSM 1495]|uniref:Uncharacterized protein n=1 Tax=Chaetomium thermophilum (strain DSM 1495 / CBS 144.50 / IMI 039719) TaxID=759272 RepID=G0S3I1_CHATD|nr:hypothetical protein CTHT_0021120 [Thermochaetoides thermophila DSM 1495]EGS22564.1 hypothetical protein CTHT_0021120 [Thermochaetoides thermophila DSM 1495]
MMLMDALTDKPDWHNKVQDETVVDKWRQEALSQDEQELWTYIVPRKQASSNLNEAADIGCGGQCIQELKIKAEFFRQTGLIYTLNADANAVIKSDSLVGADLREQFQFAFEKLQAEQQADPLWHPDMCGRPMSKTWFIHLGTRLFMNGTVKFTSYINNLHPTKHVEIYRLIERLIDIAIPAWDQILTPLTPEGGRRCCITPRRIDLGPEVEDENGDQVEDLWEDLNLEIIAAYEAEHGEIKPWGSDNPEENLSRRDKEELQDKEARWARGIARIKWKKLREPKLPEPEEFRPPNFSAGSDLRKQYKNSGLQITVKMVSIELTPEISEFEEGGWHVAQLPKRTDVSRRVKVVSSPSLMLCHRRFIALWLVDPSQRIISTANLPPQRFDWWAEAQYNYEEKPLATNDRVLRSVFGSSYTRLPVEIKDMILTECEEMETLMTREEAEKHVEQLMDERTIFDADEVDPLGTWDYNFCEH